MTRESPRPLISVRDLRHTFHSRGLRGGRGEIQALRGVHLDVGEGECLALVGESGSGKTTLVRAMLRLIQPDSGAVFYRNRDVLTLPPEDLRRFRRKAQISSRIPLVP